MNMKRDDEWYEKEDNNDGYGINDNESEGV